MGKLAPEKVSNRYRNAAFQVGGGRMNARQTRNERAP
jgi:hypothetical protein